MKAEAYASKAEESLELLGVDWFIEDNSGIATFKLYQNRPNPFSENALIGFDLSEASQVQLNILDITGRIVRQISYDGIKGYNELIINREDLDGKGVYYYQLATANGIKTKKMIVID